MKYFLDGGTHFGQGLRNIIRKEKIDHTWSIHSWEANPNTYKEYNGGSHWPHAKINFYNQALSTQNGEIELLVQSVKEKGRDFISATGQGSTTHPLGEFRENVHQGKFTEKLKVPSIDFVQWIEKNTTGKDYVIIKLDIEGNEYSILEKLVKSKCTKQISKMYIEWHGHFMADPEKYKERRNQIEAVLTNKGIQLEDWR